MIHTMYLTCYGGVGTATGANFMLETAEGDFRALVDCGIEQGLPDSDARNRRPFDYDPAAVSCLFVTHAHADHIGRIPALVSAGFSGKIFSTSATKVISAAMFDDALMIQDKEARRGDLPTLYTKEDVSRALSLWETLPYHADREVAPGISVSLKNAGHILGSAIIVFSAGHSRMAFTGDLGNSPSPLLPDAETIEGVTYCLMESVYGDRNHENREERREKLLKVVSEAIKKGGVLLIPAFSIERAQVLLHELNILVESGRLPVIPTFLDSPLAIRITEIYKNFSAEFNENARKEMAGGDDIFHFPKLRFTLQARDSGDITGAPNPKIIIAGSGMSEGGRILAHESHYLPDPKNTLLILGYQSPGTLGRDLLSGRKDVEINGAKVRVRASVRNIQGYSSHMDSDHLIEFVEKTGSSLKKVFVAMGEPRSSLFLIQRLRDYLGVDAVYPEAGKKIELEF